MAVHLSSTVLAVSRMVPLAMKNDLVIKVCSGYGLSYVSVVADCSGLSWDGCADAYHTGENLVNMSVVAKDKHFKSQMARALHDIEVWFREHDECCII